MSQDVWWISEIHTRYIVETRRKEAERDRLIKDALGHQPMRASVARVLRAVARWLDSDVTHDVDRAASRGSGRQLATAR